MPIDPSIPLAVKPFSLNVGGALQAGQNMAIQQEQARALAEQRKAQAALREQQTKALELQAAEDAVLMEVFGQIPLDQIKPSHIYGKVNPKRAGEIWKGIRDLRMADFGDAEKVRTSMLTRIGAIKALPEAMREQAYTAVVQDYVGKGLIDPQQIKPYSPETLDAYEFELLTPEQREKRTQGTTHSVGGSLVSVKPGQAPNVLYTAPEKPEHSPIYKEWKDAVSTGYTGSFTQYQNEDANRRRPVTNINAPEPLHPVIGDDGQPVLLPRSQASGRRPASAREQGRAVTSGDAGRIAEYDTALDDLKVLRGAIPAGSTGAAAKAGTMVPNFVTEWTGVGATAKSKQAVIDRVKQVIGKALEGGVLRKEDEYKYEKILPTIYDPDDVALSKLNGLESAIQQRRQRQIDALEDAGYDVAKFRARTAAKPDDGRTSADVPPEVFNVLRGKQDGIYTLSDGSKWTVQGGKVTRGN